jgi:magnesium transporter
MLFAHAIAAPRTTLAASPNAVWLDLLTPSDDERRAAEQATGLELPTRDNIAEVESSSRVYMEGETIYLSSPVSFRDAEGRSAIAPVGFVLSQHRLVTIRFAEMPVFDAYADRFAKLPAQSSAEAFAGLMEALVDRAADAMERVGGELDQLSKQAFRSDSSGARRSTRRADAELRGGLISVGRCGDALANLRDTMLGLARIVGYTEQAAPWLPSEIKQRMTTVRRDIASLNDYDQQLSAKTSFLLDAVLGFISIEQNNGVKVLTVVTVVGIPPTFVVGLYGMNFKGMPEYDWAWGYPFGWAMIIASVVVPLVWFRVKGWI